MKSEFPFMGRLTGKEALAYRDMDELQCLICGRWFQRLANHLIIVHDIHGKEYCERYGIPWRWKGATGLSGMAWRERQSKIVNAMPGMHERMSKLHLKSPQSEPGHPSTGGPGETVKRVVAETREYKNLLVCPECGTIVKTADKRRIHCSRTCASKNRPPKWAISAADSRREVLPGYPDERPFTTPEEVHEYLRQDRIQCLRCGKDYKQISSGHLLLIHGWTVEEYKSYYGLPWRRGLTSIGSQKIRSKLSIELRLGDREEALARLEKHRHKAHSATRRPRPQYREIQSNRNLGEYIPYDGLGYPETVWDEFLDRIASGRTMREVLRDEDMPGMTAYHVKRNEDPAFAQRFDEIWESLPYLVQARGQRMGQRFKDEVTQLYKTGMTQKAIGQRIGVSQATVGRHL